MPRFGPFLRTHERERAEVNSPSLDSAYDEGYTDTANQSRRLKRSSTSSPAGSPVQNILLKRDLRLANQNSSGSYPCALACGPTVPRFCHKVLSATWSLGSPVERFGS